MKALTKSGIENCRDNKAGVYRDSHGRLESVPGVRRNDARPHCSGSEPKAFGNSLSGKSCFEEAATVASRRAFRFYRVQHEIAPTIREGLEKLELALVRKEPNGPEALRTFRIVATDYACMVILPRLVKRLSGSAPRVALQVSACNHLDLGQYLQRGRCDLFIGPFDKLQAGLRRSKLLSDDEVIAVRKAHPLTLGEVTKDRLLEFPNLLVEPTETEGSQCIGSTGEKGLLRSPPAGSFSRAFREETINLAGRPAVVCHILLRWFLCFS